MPTEFRFERGDSYVKAHLSAAELNRVTTWQTSGTKYVFSFHEQHEAGWPVYLKEPDSRRSLPKVNLKEPTNPPTVLQGDSVVVKENGADFKAVVLANMARFQKLAKAYYEGADVPPPPPPRAFRFACNKGGPGFTGKIPGIVPRGGEVKWWTEAKKKPANAVKCPLHKKDECLGKPALVELTPIEATKVPFTFT